MGDLTSAPPSLWTATGDSRGRSNGPTIMGASQVPWISLRAATLVALSGAKRLIYEVSCLLAMTIADYVEFCYVKSM